MKAINIEWDTDGEHDIDLPTEIEITDSITDEDEIADYLSDTIGYCMFSFELVDN